jgi:signal transduction histidine kinase
VAPAQRRRVIDAAAAGFAAAVALVPLTCGGAVLPLAAPGWWWVDLVGGALAVVLVALRRRAPLAVALAVWALGVVAVSPAGAFCVVLFGLAVRRPWRASVALATLLLVSVPLTGLLRGLTPTTDLSATSTGWTVLVVGILLTSGFAVRARHQLVASLVDRAERAEREVVLRAEAARHAERTRIAREMHDVLAHRLTLVTMHAGALEHRPNLPPAEVAEAVGVIRSGATDALADLRVILGVLRDPAVGRDGSGTADEPPRPVLADLGQLVAQVRATGTTVRLDDRCSGHATLPDACRPTVYRVVQEALTNAARHAPGQPIDVSLGGAPGEDLRVEVRNPLPGGRPAGRPGAGTGLLGVAERVELAGGRLVAGGPEGGRFRVAVALPWPAGGPEG